MKTSLRWDGARISAKAGSSPAGLLDEIRIDLAAMLLGAGLRMFDHLDNTPVILGDPTVVAGVGVTHRRYPVLPTKAAHAA
jgi:hypothetical protein